MHRREFLKLTALSLASSLGPVAAQPASPPNDLPTLRVDPQPLHDLSPWLYMQFMEPLGVTDGSVEASWDHLRQDWRPDLVEVTRELAPGMLRWGGLFSAYYRWREGVGPRAARKPMLNLVWGGIESNQVGTAEFVDFCRRIHADPLMCVNFESEGDKDWAVNARGEVRSADAKEAAAWVDYCNSPANLERLAHGHRDPLPIKVWQIGNETSYSPKRFNRDTAIVKTIQFSQAMRQADPEIKLIGWGGSGWAKAMIERAGEHLSFIAFHHLFDPGKGSPDSPLRDGSYRKDFAATWDLLMGSVRTHEQVIQDMRRQVAPYKFPLALTECHFTMPGRNRCDLNSCWAAGVAYARFLNLHQRHGDLLKIANLADFCGTRWQSNAIMLPVPGGKAYMMPVAKVMALYRKHSGRQFVAVSQVP
ncbi:MAG TPA: hypothetical protein VNT26_01155, partial [Candidatus Sulfotelmatobacter sp.]|nr:hypothetical protein [Candidatus Sulfotelmatobacter sp.]